ncbi:MAG: ABC transporter permease [Candidatus Nanopelagicales bacterium]
MSPETLPDRRATAGKIALAWPAYLYWARVFRRVLRSELIGTFVVPAVGLLAFGFGLGALVDTRANADLGVEYAVFIAPGLIAGAAMQTANDGATWNVLGAIKWWKTYHAMLATPLGVREVFLGHLAWITTHAAMAGAGLLLVAAVFGLVPSAWGVLSVVAAALVGLAFATPLMALAASTENAERFALVYRFVVVPLFLFSATFFPVSQLPDLLEWVAWLTPLFHGVELTRDLTLGTIGWVDLVHVGVLLAYAGVGALLAMRAFDRRLRS